MDAIVKLYIGWSLYDLLCLFLFIVIGFHLKFNNKQIAILCISIASVIAIFGNAITMDYRAYWKIMQQIIYGSHRYIHLEPLYVYIIHKIGLNYELWQTIVYVPAYFVFYLIIKDLKIQNIELFLFMFVVLIMYYDCVGSRQFLFVTIYYYGIVKLANKKWILGILLLTTSAFCHKMAFMALPLVPLYYISLRKKLLLIFVCTIFATVITAIAIAPFLDAISIITGFGNSEYLTNDQIGNANQGSIWWTIIGKYTHYVRLILLWYCLYQARNITYSSSRIHRTIYALVFLTSCCSLFFEHIGINGTISYRLLSLGAIGFCYLFSILPKYRTFKNFQRVLFGLSMLGYWILTNAFIKGVSNSIMLGELQLE